MRVHAEQVAVDGAHGPLLAPTSLTVAAGQLALVRGEPGTGHTAFGLVVTGRLRPTSGQITLAGGSADSELRRISALVDAPGVSAPESALTLTDLVAEELAMTGRPGGRRAVADWLAAHRAAEYAGQRLEAIPAAVRIRVLTELAAARPGVRLLVLDQPDRHTGNTQAWWPLALRQAEHGNAVVVLCATSSARLLPITAAQLGRDEQPAPLTVTVGAQS